MVWGMCGGTVTYVLGGDVPKPFLAGDSCPKPFLCGVSSALSKFRVIQPLLCTQQCLALW